MNLNNAYLGYGNQVKSDRRRILPDGSEASSAEGFSSFGPDDEADAKTGTLLAETNWRSIYVASALSFIGTAQFTLYFSSMWPYLQIIDRSISESFFGYIIAIYSLGQILASPLFGYVSNMIGAVRPLLFVGLVLMFVGNATYLGLELVDDFPKRYLLLMGRLITGAGSGNVMLLRTYASTASTTRDRSKAIAIITCGQAVGLTSGPALQLFFTSLRYPGHEFPIGGMHINLYTAPAYLACVMNIIGAAILYTCFREEYAGLVEGGAQLAAAAAAVAATSAADVEAQKKRENATSDKTALETALEDLERETHPSLSSRSATHSPPPSIKTATRLKKTSNLSSSVADKTRLPSYDRIAVVVCLLTRFTYMFINTNLETIGSPYSMMMFAWSESKTVFYTSLAQGGIGLLTLGTYVAWILLRLERYLSYRVCCIGALFALVIFHLVTYSWPFIAGQVHIQNITASWVLELMDSDDEPVGCDALRFAWCASLRPVNVWLYYVSYVLTLGLAFPVLNVTNSTLYADVLGPRRQGLQQSVLQMAGGMARLLGPIIISALYSAYGPTMAWKMEISVIAITLLPWLLFYRRMIPLMRRHRLTAIGSVAPNSPAGTSAPIGGRKLDTTQIQIDEIFQKESTQTIPKESKSSGNDERISSTGNLKTFANLIDSKTKISIMSIDPWAEPIVREASSSTKCRNSKIDGLDEKEDHNETPGENKPTDNRSRSR